MYYILVNDIRYESNVKLEEPKNLPVELSFITGKVITTTFDKPIEFSTNACKGDEIRDFLRGSILLLSKRFLALIQDAGVDNLQIFPAIIKSDVDGTIWGDFFAVNVIGTIACANLRGSTFDEIMPGHYIFDELAIDAEKAKGALLFRLNEHIPSLIIAKNVIKHIIDNDPDDQITGWEFNDIIQ